MFADNQSDSLRHELMILVAYAVAGLTVTLLVTMYIF
jgi:hypothetical protein